MRILITGATGFCGAHLLNHLESQGYEVFGTGTDSKKLRRFKHPVLLDVKDDAMVRKVIRQLKPGAVLHLAGQSVPRLSWIDPESTFEVNVGGTIALLKALRNSAPEARFVFASSTQVYGRTFLTNPGAREVDPIWPENPYSFSKMAAEIACLDFSNRFNLDVVIARSVNFLGTGQRTDFVFADWCRQIVLSESGKRPPILEVGNLGVSRNFLHVKDGVLGYETLLFKGKRGNVYNLSGKKSRPLKEYLGFLLSQSRVKLELRVRKEKFRKDDAPCVEPSNHKLCALGWKEQFLPEVALEELLISWRQKIKESLN